MSEPKHTSGPWTTGATTLVNGCAGVPVYAADKDGHYLIALCLEVSDAGRHPNAYANAALIASAPSLLSRVAELEEALRFIAEDSPRDGWYGIREVQNYARAALAGKEGRK